MKKNVRLERDTLIGVAVILVLIASWAIGNMLFIAQESGPGSDVGGFKGSIDTDDTLLSITIQNWIVIFFLSFVGLLYMMTYFYGDAEFFNIYGKIMGVVLLMAGTIYFGAEIALTHEGYGIILAGTMIVAGVFYLLYRRGVSLKWRVVGSVLTIIVLFAAFSMIQRTFPTPEEGSSGSGTPFGLGGGEAFDFIEQHTGLVLLPILILALVLLFYLSDIKKMIHPPEKEEEMEIEDEFSESVKSAIEDLYKGKDVRSTIIRCYQRMCRALEESGVSNDAFITPREFEKKALAQLDVSESTIKDLTTTFEEARYSDHPLKEDKRKRALRDLHKLREGLVG